MTNLSVEEIDNLKEEKEEIEKEISSKITTFQLKYGVKVSEINFHHSMPSAGKVPQKTDISIKIEID